MKIVLLSALAVVVGVALLSAAFFCGCLVQQRIMVSQIAQFGSRLEARYKGIPDSNVSNIAVVNLLGPDYIGTIQVKYLELIADAQGRAVSIRVREKGTDPGFPP